MIYSASFVDQEDRPLLADSGGLMLLAEATALHPALQDENGGHTIHGLAPFLDGKFGLAKQTIGFCGGEALVPEMYWHFEMLAKVLGEHLDLLGLCPLSSRHAQGQSDDDFFDLVLLDDPTEKLQIVFLFLAVKGLEALGCNTERIGDRNTDASSPDIETKDTVGSFSLHRRNYRELPVSSGLSSLSGKRPHSCYGLQWCGRSDDGPRRPQRSSRNRFEPGAWRLQASCGQDSQLAQVEVRHGDRCYRTRRSSYRHDAVRPGTYPPQVPHR